MLLLLTIGLVLVATVALVIGFVTSALAPIYVSIACSVAAALVLFFFSRLSKREVPATAGGPAPLPAPAVAGERAGSTVTVLDSAPSAPPAPPAAEPATEQVPVIGADEEAALLEAEMQAEEEAARQAAPAHEAFAPEGLIAAAEPAGAHRAAEEWQPEPFEAEPFEAEALEEEEPEAEEAETEEAEAPAGFGAAAAVGAWPTAGETEDEAPAGEEELIFPIADYDDLRVSEILPLLPELDEDELQMVREREQQGRARFSILTRLDQLMAQLGGAVAAAAPSQGFEEDLSGVGVPSTVEGAGVRVDQEPSYEPSEPPQPPALTEPTGPPEPPAAEPFGVPYGEGAQAIEAEGPEPGIEQPEITAPAEPAAPSAEPEPTFTGATGAEPAPEPTIAQAAAAAEPVERAFPIADYDSKKVTEILPLLTNMGADDLARVAAYEQRGRARGSVLSRIEQLQARASETAPPPTTVKKVTAKKTTVKKAATSAKKAPEPAKKAAGPAKKAAASAKKPAEPATTTAAAKRAATAKKLAAAKAAEAQKTTKAAKAPAKTTKASKASSQADVAPADQAPEGQAPADQAPAAQAPAEKAAAKKAPSRTTKKQ